MKYKNEILALSAASGVALLVLSYIYVLKILREIKNLSKTPKELTFTEKKIIVLQKQLITTQKKLNQLQHQRGN